MSVETSNAPREVWTINFRDNGDLAGEFPIGDKRSAEDFAVQGSAFFGQACEAVEYLRRDLVVPTVDDEMVDAAAWIVARDVGYPYLSDVPDGEWQAITSQAREMLTAVRALLLSRIEGRAACSEGDNA